jgi:hypothetical protein
MSFSDSVESGLTTAIQDKAGFKFLATRRRESSLSESRLSWFLRQLRVCLVLECEQIRMPKQNWTGNFIDITVWMKKSHCGKQHAIHDIDDLTFINLSVSLARLHDAVLPILIRILSTQRPQDPHRPTPIPAPENCPMV